MPLDMRHRVRTLAFAALGTWLFWAIEFPLPFLFGPMAACLMAALLGQPLKGMGQVSKGMRTILGVAVGASVTPALVDQLPAMAMSVAFIPLYILVIGIAGVPYFHRIAGLDKPTAYYAAMPAVTTAAGGRVFVATDKRICRPVDIRIVTHCDRVAFIHRL